MDTKPKICVIMSTYNGEKYLKTQIESILNQKDVDLTLHIFDDISKDNTVPIAKEYEKNNTNVFVHINEINKNFTYNFLDALFSFKNNDKFEYYAFADQDDYWLDNKLISAIKMIEEKGKCTLYSANLKIVDKELNPICKEMEQKDYKMGHYDILYGNFVTGCTIVMDKEFKNLATKYYPDNIYFHDYWLAVIAHYSKGANFVYDSCPNYILYRQHGNNIVGNKKECKIKLLLKLLFCKVDKKNSNYLRYKTYYSLYKDDIKEEDKTMIEKTANIKKLKNKIYLFNHIKIKFHRKIIYLLKMILNKY